MIEERARLPELRERIRRIERPTAAVHGVLPFGIAAIDRVLPGGGLARGALHEILGMGGDEEDGALAAAFAAGILGRLARERRRTAWCCGVFPARTSTGPVSPPMGSIPRASCWSGHRATPRSCGRWRRGCALPASPRWSAKSGRSPRSRAAGCSSPRSAPASPLFCCGAGATAGRRRANAICRMRR